MPQRPTRTRPERARTGLRPESVRDRGDACPGALRLHAADDGALARIRVPGGLLTPRQTFALADAAGRLGDGHLGITSRGNLQLRGLSGTDGPQLAALLEDLGMLPSVRHERVRNVVASPLSGLDGAGNAEVRPWAARLDELLCASEAAAELSGRFLFALDDGRGDVASLGADVTLIALPGSAALLRVGAGPEAVRVSAEEAAGSALTAAEMFLTAARESGSGAWRVRELPDGHGVFAREVAALINSGGVRAEHVPAGAWAAAVRGPTGGPPPGVVEGPSPDRCALSVLAPLGRLEADRWRRLAAVQEECGEGELRVTPWRGVVLPGLPRRVAAQRLRDLGQAGLITHADSPWSGVGACTGLPGCARSHRDVRADAEAALAEGQSGALPVYWSGCERRCGRPQGDRVDVVAGEGGYTVAVQAEGSAPPRVRAVPDGELAHAVASARAGQETIS